MKLIYSPIQSGKTTRMIEWLREDQSGKEESDRQNRLLITFSVAEERRLQEQYPDVKEKIIAWENYQRSIPKGGYRMGGTDRVISIDNADMILQRMCIDEIDTITTTKFPSIEDENVVE